MRVFALSDYFPPSQRGGSGLALFNSIIRHDDRCEFAVLTRDHDPRTRHALPVISNEWLDVGPARVRYSSVDGLSRRHILHLIREVGPDLIYLNSVFSPLTRRILWARRSGRLSQPVLLAPEGELLPGPLQIKPLRKHVYLHLSRGAGIYRDVAVRAVSHLEVSHIRRWFADSRLVLAGNPQRNDTPKPCPLRSTRKFAGRVNLLYLSRIDRRKNLLYLLRVIEQLQGDIRLRIVGNVESSSYWAACRRVWRRLPSNIRVLYEGECAAGDVWKFYNEADLLVLPTLGENYGYVIAEALASGLPVAISDTTPWTSGILAGAGWSMPLDNLQRWRRTVQSVVMFDHTEWLRMSSRALAIQPPGSELPTLQDAIVDLAERSTPFATELRR